MAVGVHIVVVLTEAPASVPSAARPCSRDVSADALRTQVPPNWTLLSGNTPLENFESLGTFSRSASGRSTLAVA